jgi:putative cell wall-binding protein
MKLVARSLVSAGVLLSFVGGGVAHATTTETDQALTRIAGSTRSGTAVEASQYLFPDDHTAHKVLLVNEDAPWDALAAGPLASMLGPTSILLSDKNTLNADTRTELDRVLKTNVSTMSAQGETGTSPAAKVIIVGGTGAISTAVEDAIKDIRDDIATTRISGESRYDTACAIVDEMDVIRGARPERVFVASGEAATDSLVAATYGANKTLNGQHTSVLLTPDDALPQCVLNYLDQHGIKPAEGTTLPATPTVKKAIIFGGLSRVSQAVSDALATRVTSVERIAGDTRYKTASDAAEIFFGESNQPSSIVVARGDSPFDALSAAPIAGGKKKAPLLLVTPELPIPAGTVDYLNGHKTHYTGGLVFGGEAAVGTEVVDAIQAIYMP